MGDVPYPKEPEPTTAERVNAEIAEVVEKMDKLYRTTLAGDRRGRVRRPTLFLVVAIALILNVPVVGMLALGALMLTDTVVDLD